jgi:ubiquinone/menaquinone biosynthesis C-methylase UbiE
MSEKSYLPAAGLDVLLPMYDPLQRFLRSAGLHREMARLAEFRAGQRVLDVGCGTGNLLCAIGRQRGDLELTGVDPDPRALARAARKASRSGVSVTWTRGFAEELPFPDGSFDRVLSSLMFHHLDGDARDGMLAEVRRVLRPDGVLVLADLGLDGDRGHGLVPHRMWRTPRMHEHVGDGIPRRIEAAGLRPAPAVPYRLRGVSTSIVVAATA